jgi:hypothetical protein
MFLEVAIIGSDGSLHVSVSSIRCLSVHIELPGKVVSFQLLPVQDSRQMLDWFWYLVRGHEYFLPHLSQFNLSSACHLLSRWFLARLILRPWRWRRCVPPKRRLAFSGLHGIISQKIVLFITYMFDKAALNKQNIPIRMLVTISKRSICISALRWNISSRWPWQHGLA